ncbi:MAG: TIGR04255 family protein [Leptolyngbyaceae cyanobacterium RM2_2_4]|nr:TIGR04255 family protein [Leptolyngbyaceae cyanobacterium SM1_4_3]NJN90326.1 TIGR04255 family protein [Leptolyngbyaceae cyanobacterium SL_5_14]NJO49920.1 TIGR04255 family protein [Leptolyngbyaceae cyanobacterium RM2_2_4]
MASHAPWRNPPLQEAVFEVRFPPVDDYSIFVGGMAEVKRNRFPKVDRLPADELPPSIVVSGAVRHRFTTEDKSLLFQTGQDVISVNAISYSGFTTFANDIEDILRSAQNYADVGRVSRLGLRYINRFEKVESPFQILNIVPPFSDFDLSKTEKIQANYIKQELNKLFLSKNVDFPVADSNLIFDLDAFQQDFDLDSLPWDIKTIVDWADKTHDIVWENFESLVSETERSRRE